MNKPQRHRDEEYLAYIRSQYCSVEGCYKCQDKKYKIDPHHINGGGASTKCSDYLTMPLCREHHIEAERGKETFLRNHPECFKKGWELLAEKAIEMQEYIEVLKEEIDRLNKRRSTQF